MEFVSISIPPSPTADQLQTPRRMQFSDDGKTAPTEEVQYTAPASSDTKLVMPMPAKFYSQPLSHGSMREEAANSANIQGYTAPQKINGSTDSLRDTTFDSFRTCPGKLERQLSVYWQKSAEPGPEPNNLWSAEADDVPMDRYFNALEGPELESLKQSEELLLPEDRKWPFLLRYPISSFSICLGFSSQAILWKNLATSPSTKFLHIDPAVNFVLWCISVALVLLVTSIYTLKMIFFFEAVRREYYHPIRANFFFAPWIVLLLLAVGIPSHVNRNLPHALWYALMSPLFCLELKIYGEWMSGGERRLSKVANPASHLAIAGNFVGAMLGASMGLKEGPMFFFAVGMAHYLVLFVTLYQRLPSNETLPKEFHPIFFLFVVPPSISSLAWAKIQGSFDSGSRICYFVALFLYFSLAVRLNFFRGFRFSLAWWAYTVPMTAISMATIKYSDEVTTLLTHILVVVLTSVSTITIIALFITTIVHAFILHDLFPNDIAIAIRNRPLKPSWTWFQLKPGGLNAKDMETWLRYVDPRHGSSMEEVAEPPCKKFEDA
ncbi:S-type anion channel SLAH3-like protein [Drosera capensis]